MISIQENKNDEHQGQGQDALELPISGENRALVQYAEKPSGKNSKDTSSKLLLLKSVGEKVPSLHLIVHIVFH